MSESIDDRLNPIFVEEKLLEIFNRNKDESDNYTSEYATLPLPGNQFLNVIFIYNNGNMCYKLNLPSYKNGQYVITGGMNTRCGDNKSGTKNITNIIQFGIKNGYDIFELYNISEINYNFPDKSKVSIQMTILKLLEIGNSWYSQFGFESEEKIELQDGQKIPISKYLQQSISPIISSSFGNLMVKYNEYVDYLFSQTLIKSKLQNDVKEDFNGNINGYINEFNRTNIPELTISNDTIISDYIKNIVRVTIAKCPRNMCPNDFNHLLRQLIDFIYFLSYVVVSVVIKNTVLVTTSDQNRIKDEIIDFIGSNYNKLELNLKDSTSRRIGGKGRKIIKKNKKCITRRKKYKRIKKSRKSTRK